MFDYDEKSTNRKRNKTTKYDSHFWDKLIRVLFLSGVVIILLMIALKWLGFLDQITQFHRNSAIIKPLDKIQGFFSNQIQNLIYPNIFYKLKNNIYSVYQWLINLHV